MIKLPRIVHGVETRAKVTRQVEFVCPRCGVDRDGVVIEPQRWFCVLGIPAIPLATLDPAVECAACGHHAGLGVLDVLSTAALSQCLANAMRESAAYVARAGGRDAGAVDQVVIEELVDVMRASGFEYDETTLARDLATTGDARTVDDVLQFALRPLVEELTPHGKQGFLHRMIAIALADGPLDRDEQQALVTVGIGLGMAAPHINGVLATAAIQHQAVA